MQEDNPPKRRGRPPGSGKPFDAAERVRRYRIDQERHGRKQLSVYLSVEAIHHLDELARVKEKSRSQVLEDMLVDDLDRMSTMKKQASNVLEMKPSSTIKKTGKKPV